MANGIAKRCVEEAVVVAGDLQKAVSGRMAPTIGGPGSADATVLRRRLMRALRQAPPEAIAGELVALPRGDMTLLWEQMVQAALPPGALHPEPSAVVVEQILEASLANDPGVSR